MKNPILIFLVILIFSCKNDKKHDVEDQKEIQQTEKQEVENVLIEDNVFILTMFVKVFEDDKFELYYVDDSIDGNFNSKNRLAVYVVGSNEFQTIQFKLPENSLPYKFRIDLGDNGNKYETNIEIKSITLQLNGNTIELDHTTMDSFFQPNVYLQKTDTGYSRKVVDGKYDPFLLAKPVLIKKMELEL